MERAETEKREHAEQVFEKWFIFFLGVLVGPILWELAS
jgi:hypothetical protein